jgi:putative transposase
MDQLTVRKTFKYKLKPTPKQEQAMAFVLRRCHELYNAALQERRDAWQKCGVSITTASQSAQLPAIKEVRPEYRDLPRCCKTCSPGWIAPSRRSSAG